MWIVIAILALVLLFWSNKKSQPSVNGVTARFFGKDSTNMFTEMSEDGLSPASLQEFITMEDLLLSLEKQSVCSKVSNTTNATAISQKIKDRFVGYDFGYHDMHIRQIAFPDRLINTQLTCF